MKNIKISLKKYYFVCLLLLIPFNSTADVLTKSQAQANLEKYMNILLGDSKPTVSDFYYFYGHHNELEVAEEQYYCQHVIKDEEKCARFFAHRDNSDSSLYLDRLQNHLHRINGKFTVGALKFIQDNENFCHYNASGILGTMPVKFYVAACPYSQELGGIVQILTINNVNIEEIIKPRY